MSRFSPLPFSPLYAFTALRPMTIGGVAYEIGDMIDKAAIPPYRLRQLYDARKISPHAPEFLFNGTKPAANDQAGQGERAPATPAPGPENAADDASSARAADAAVVAVADEKPTPRSRRRERAPATPAPGPENAVDDASSAAAAAPDAAVADEKPTPRRRRRA